MPKRMVFWHRTCQKGWRFGTISFMERQARYFSPPKSSYFLFGPRGSGKSTWVKKNTPANSIYIDLLLPEVIRRYTSNPEDLLKVIEANPSCETVIIDEIQKAPELLSVVHAVIESPRKVKFILTGSSARKLKRVGVDLLSGRAIKTSMHPFIGSEIATVFKLEKALQIGMLPLIWGAEEQMKVLKSYVDLYIMEEVKLEGLARNVGDFSRFLSTMTFSHGSLLNVTNVARECEVKRKTVENYISILEDLLLAYLVLPFTKRAKRLLTGHPKFYYFDCGVYRVLRKARLLDSNEEISGAALEGLVMQHLKAWCDYSEGDHEIFYWRTKAGLEVDFIVYGDIFFYAIEVKHNTKVSSKDVTGLLHFKEDYPECTPLLLYRGTERIMEKGILCLPCEVFLKNLRPDETISYPSFT